MTIRVLPALSLVLGLAVPAGAAPVVHREVLPNGIVLLVAERPAVPIVAVRMHFRAGSVFDPPDTPGLANLAAELLTRGTATRPASEIDRAIEFVGGDLDTECGRDGMTVALSILKKDLTLGLDILADVVRTPAFPEDELRRKAAEIQAGIRRSDDNPDAIASRELMGLVYAAHPYGHPVEGTSESVGAITRERVVDFYRRHVRPDGAVIAVVGAITVDQARQEILARFGDWPRPSTPVPRLPALAVTPSARTRTLSRDLTQTTVYMGRPAIRQDDPDYFPLVVANYILGGGSVSRLYVRVREESGLAYSVGSWIVPGRYGATAFVTLQTRTNGAARALRLTTDEMARLGRELPSDRDLTLAKSYLVGSFPRRLDTSSKVAGFLVGVEEHGLGLDYADTFRRRIGAVTAEDVRRVAARYLAPDTFDTVTVGRVEPAPKSE